MSGVFCPKGHCVFSTFYCAVLCCKQVNNKLLSNNTYFIIFIWKLWNVRDGDALWDCGTEWSVRGHRRFFIGKTLHLVICGPTCTIISACGAGACSVSPWVTPHCMLRNYGFKIRWTAGPTFPPILVHTEGHTCLHLSASALGTAVVLNSLYLGSVNDLVQCKENSAMCDNVVHINVPLTSSSKTVLTIYF